MGRLKIILLTVLVIDLIIGAWLLLPVSATGLYHTEEYKIILFSDDKNTGNMEGNNGFTYGNRDLWIRSGKVRLSLYRICFHEKLHNTMNIGEEGHELMKQVPIDWLDKDCSMIYMLSI